MVRSRAMNGLSEDARAVLAKMRDGALLSGALGDYGRGFGLKVGQVSENVNISTVEELLGRHLIEKAQDLGRGYAEYKPVA